MENSSKVDLGIPSHIWIIDTFVTAWQLGYSAAFRFSSAAREMSITRMEIMNTIRFDLRDMGMELE